MLRSRSARRSAAIPEMATKCPTPIERYGGMASLITPAHLAKPLASFRPGYERLPTTKQRILVCSTSISPPIVQTMLWQMTGSPAAFGMGLPSGPLTMRCSSIGTQSTSTQSRRPLDDLTGMPSRAHQRPSDRSSASVAWQSFFEQQLANPGRLRSPYQASRSGRLQSWP
jgi:hypothetical protein